MSGDDFTIDEKMSFAAGRAKEIEAEKHFFDKAQPFFPLGFSVGYRNPGHWDIYAASCPGKVSAFYASHGPASSTSAKDGDRERAFRIRGEPGNVILIDERWNPHKPFPRVSMQFRSVSAAMLWVVEELMAEPCIQKARS